VDGFGDELGFGGEEDEVGDELLGWEGRVSLGSMGCDLIEMGWETYQ
jgi:hypothetical protein